MTKKKRGIKFVRRPLPRPKKLTVFTGFVCVFGTGILGFCLMKDVHLAGGYDFMAKTPEAKLIAKILGAAASLIGLRMVGLSFTRPKILETTLGVVVLGLAVHIPVIFALADARLGWFVGIVAAVTFLAFILAGTKRVQEDLLRFGPDARLASY
jgi:FtsH-binding integral membrane protein